MESLKINRAGHTLVDQVEEKLIEYFKDQGLRPGSSIPNENELAASLGIGRTVLREALSRFKMTGMIESRTKRGMTLGEPSILRSLKRCINPLLMNESTLLDILGFRIALEIGSSGAIFSNITPEYVRQLERIVVREETGAVPLLHLDECEFHEKLYEIMNNKTIAEFQETIMPALAYITHENKKELNAIRERIRRRDGLVTHRELLEYIKKGDEESYYRALRKHFNIYIVFIEERKARLAAEAAPHE